MRRKYGNTKFQNINTDILMQTGQVQSIFDSDTVNKIPTQPTEDNFEFDSEFNIEVSNDYEPVYNSKDTIYYEDGEIIGDDSVDPNGQIQ